MALKWPLPPLANLESISEAFPVNKDTREHLIKVAMTTLGSKVVV